MMGAPLGLTPPEGAPSQRPSAGSRSTVGAMHLRAWRKRDRECRREMWVTVGAPELTVKGSARRLPAGLAGPDPRPKAASGQRLAIYGPVDDGAACETLVRCDRFSVGAAPSARGLSHSQR